MAVLFHVTEDDEVVDAFLIYDGRLGDRVEVRQGPKAASSAGRLER